MKFAVHLFPAVRVKVIGIEAGDAQAAVKAAESSVDLHALFDRARPGPANIECTEWDEGACHVILVDHLDASGKVEDDESKWVDGATGELLVNGRTTAEHKAHVAQTAIAFYEEVLGVTETIYGIAETHGVETLSDVFYLQAAILKESCIEHLPCGKSRIQDFVKALPSVDLWLKYIKLVDDEPTAFAAASQV
jgi:hypothetical protein